MSEIDLPESWELTTIGETCLLNPKVKLDDDLEIGFMPMAGVPTDYFGNCEFESLKWKEKKTGFTQFQDGDAIFAKITPCFENSKAAVISGFPSGWGAGSTEYYVLRPIGKYVDPRILFALVKTREFLVNGAVNMSGSVGHKRVPKEFVANYSLPLPPLAEQKLIADKLDTLLAQVETTKARLERIPHILKRFRQSVLAAAVSGKLTAEWRGSLDLDDIQSQLKVEWLDHQAALIKAKGGKVDSNKLEKKYNSVLPITVDKLDFEIKNGWFSFPLKSLILEKNQGVNTTTEKVNYTDHGIPAIQAGNIGPGTIEYSTEKFITEEKYSELSGSVKPKIGDVLYTNIGANFGNSAVVKDDCVFLITWNVLRIKCHSLLLSDYLSIVLNTDRIRTEARNNVSTSTVPFVNGKKIDEFLIPLPPLKEQKEIVRRVEQLFAHADTIEQQVQAAQTRVNNLTQSILAKAFRGELTAEWRAANPDLISGENSAEALLAKIKAEREAMSPKKKVKKKTVRKKKMSV